MSTEISTMLNKNLFYLRSLLGLSQAAMGKLAGVSGAYISAIEKGTRTQLSYQTLSIMSQKYGVSEDWIKSGIINKNRRDYLQGGKLIQRWDLNKIADKTKVPLQFIEAIFSGEISPSDEFYLNLCKLLNIPPMEDFSERVDEALNKIKEGVIHSRISVFADPPPDGYEVVPADDRVEKLRTQLDTCYERYFDLKERFDSLEREYEKLRKAGS